MISILTPVILLNLIMEMIGAFQCFVELSVITKGEPSDAALPYGLLLDNAFVYFRMGYASAMAWMLFVPIMVIMSPSPASPTARCQNQQGWGALSAGAQDHRLR